MSSRKSFHALSKHHKKHLQYFQPYLHINIVILFARLAFNLLFSRFQWTDALDCSILPWPVNAKGRGIIQQVIGIGYTGKYMLD